jgi:hypothetical protein
MPESDRNLSEDERFQNSKVPSHPSSEPVTGRRNLASSRCNIAPGRRNIAPGRRNIAPGRRNIAPGRRNIAPGRCNIAPGRCNIAPGRCNIAPGRCNIAPGRCNIAPGRCNIAPGRCNIAPGRRCLFRALWYARHADHGEGRSHRNRPDKSMSHGRGTDHGTRHPVICQTHDEVLPDGDRRG